MKIRRVLNSLIAAIAIVAAPLPSIALSLPGQPLDSAVKDDFFTWFHFKRVPEVDERDNLNTVYFSTRHPSANNDVIVSVDTDKKDKILQMSLIVDREFIDSPKSNVFARDIVKSFIQVATPPEDQKQTSSLVDEIFFRSTEMTPTKVSKVVSDGKETDMPADGKLLKVGKGELKKGDVALMMAGDVPKLPDKVSHGYEAFQGKIKDYELPMSRAKLVLHNVDLPKGQFLEIRVDMNGVKKVPKLEIVK